LAPPIILSSLVGLTAMDVSLLGLVFSQLVSTLAVCWVFVVQILSPGRMLCAKSIG
jgi:hypothetical protein